MNFTKKLTLSVAALAVMTSSVFADTNSTRNWSELQKVVQERFGFEAEVIDSTPLKSIEGMDFVVGKSKLNGELFPIFATKDGKNILGVSPFVVLNDMTDNIKINEMLSKASQEEKAQKQAMFMGEVLAKLDPNSFLVLENKNADSVMYVVTDPECPYCRGAMKEVEEKLKGIEIRMVFAPVHGESAFKKSALIMKEAKKAKTNKEKIAILNKYYAENFDNKKLGNIDIKAIQDNVKIVFDPQKRIIQGVPYMMAYPRAELAQILSAETNMSVEKAIKTK